MPLFIFWNIHVSSFVVSFLIFRDHTFSFAEQSTFSFLFQIVCMYTNHQGNFVILFFFFFLLLFFYNFFTMKMKTYTKKKKKLQYLYLPLNGRNGCRQHAKKKKIGKCPIPLITETCLYNFDPFKPHFRIVKPGFTGVYIIFLISAQNIDCGYSWEPPRLGEAVLTSTHNLCFEQKYEKYQSFFIWKFSVFGGENLL